MPAEEKKCPVDYSKVIRDEVMKMIPELKELIIGKEKA